MEQYIQFFINHWELSLAFVVILGLLAFVEMRGQVRGIMQISPQDLTQLINHEDAVVLDVRGKESFDKGHIINAIHIPLADLSRELHSLEKYKEKQLVIYCGQGNESVTAAVQLKKAGFNDVKSLKGGIAAWQGAQMPLVKS